MNILSSNLKEGSDMSENENTVKTFHYSPAKGGDNVVEVSIIDKGEKLSVLFETFSEAQFELFERLKNGAERVWKPALEVVSPMHLE
jgi:hypothetical protein